MKSVFVVLAAFAASVVAQLDKMPACATPCIAPMLSSKDAGGCDSGDVKCICSNQGLIEQIGQCLITQNCSVDDMRNTISTAYDLCLAAGVTIQTTLPTPVATTGVTVTTGTQASVTYAPTATGRRNITTNTTTTTTTTDSNGAAATGYVANGLGVAGAAVAAFLFL
ncbi:hypothetical protein EV426DRAFT_717784 [Tirmania nivea]|nr:hypothetical protein EV426DRAFT_717784 [Tirmania nivea]